MLYWAGQTVRERKGPERKGSSMWTRAQPPNPEVQNVRWAVGAIPGEVR